jgi:hypothetical protein
LAYEIKRRILKIVPEMDISPKRHTKFKQNACQVIKIIPFISLSCALSVLYFQ